LWLLLDAQEQGIGEEARGNKDFYVDCEGEVGESGSGHLATLTVKAGRGAGESVTPKERPLHQIFRERFSGRDAI
jgi:hypothetical protein